MALTKVTYGLLSADTSAIDLNIDANTLYVDSSANRVGIGTSSPTSFLHVKHANNTNVITESVGDYFPSTSIKRTGGSSKTDYHWEFQIGSTGFLNFKDRTNSYYPIILNASGDLLLGNNTSGANPTMFIDQSTARVGIGTSSPGHPLHISSSETIHLKLSGTATSGTGIYIDNDRTGSKLFGILVGNIAAGAFSIKDEDAGATRFVINSSGSITFNQAYTFPTSDGSANQVLQTDGSGALSFGTISTSDNTKLPLSGGTLTGALTTNGVINTGTSHNFAINTPNSLRINIDSDNNNSGEVFVVGHNQTAVDASNNVLFSVLAANGNVGMGTGSPGAPLDIETAGNTQDGTYYSTVTINNTGSNTFSGVRFDRSGVAKWRVGLKNDDVFQISNLYTGGTTANPDDECFNISNSSSIGLGTASPTAKIHMKTTGTEKIGIAVQNSQRHYGIGTTTQNLLIEDISAGGTQRLVINPSGRVQIGTATTFNAGLHVSNGDIRTTSAAFANDANSLSMSWESSGIGYLTARGPSTSERGKLGLSVNRSNGAAGITGLLIDNDGAVLINTTVNAESQAMRIRQGGSNANAALSLDSDTGDQSYYRYMRFYRKGQTSSVAKLDIDWSGSSIGLSFTSDARLKTVTGEADGLELITRLNPVKYVWKSEPDREGAQGFLAQEVEQAYYETGNSHARGVSRPIDGEKWYMLDDTTLIPNLVKAIKELKDENDALKARVEALES